MRYKVTRKSTANPNKRIKTTKYWNKKSLAQKYADDTNKMYNNVRARVVKCPRMKRS